MFIVLGSCLATVGGTYLYQNYQYQTWPRTDAKVISVANTQKIETFKNGGIALVNYYTPTMQFTAAGVLQTVTAAPTTKGYDVGFTIPIAYDPDNPATTLQKQPHTNRSMITLFSMGAASFIIGCVLLRWFTAGRRRLYTQQAIQNHTLDNSQ
jgi:hypothetical protein